LGVGGPNGSGIVDLPGLNDGDGRVRKRMMAGEAVKVNSVDGVGEDGEALGLGLKAKGD